MTDLIEFDASRLTKRFRTLYESGDAQGLLQLCRAIKSHAACLIQGNLPDEAASLMSSYHDASYQFEGFRSEFLAEIIELFPMNKLRTMNLLGRLEALDRLIIDQKLNIQTLQADKSNGYEELIMWSIRHGEWALMEKVVLHIAQYAQQPHADATQSKRRIGGSLFQTLIRDNTHPHHFPSCVDDALSTLLDLPAVGQYGGGAASLAFRGMSKTLITMLVHGSICESRNQKSQNVDIIFDCLPKHPSSKELYAIHYFIDLPGQTANILFNEKIDLEGYLQAMREGGYSKYTRPDLNIKNLKRLPDFVSHMTEANLAIPARRSRIATLLNAFCDEPDAAEGLFDPRELKTKLLEAGVPKAALKYVRRLKAMELEDDLGM